MIESPSTPQEVAKILGVNRAKIASFISSGQLKAVDISLPGATLPRYRILPEYLEEFLESRTTTASQPPPKKQTRKKSARPEILDIPEFI
ncbi:helix-turn-helix domain-containing protein [Planctomycetaceae bacterium]|nr:helix-turn-helix domain-containing protein [Planctomycetaceae bacterium]